MENVLLTPLSVYLHRASAAHHVDPRRRSNPPKGGRLLFAATATLVLCAETPNNMASVFRAACAVRQRALPMLRGYATGAPRLGAAAALRVQSSAYGSTIWWPDVSSISKHPSVLVPPTHSHSIEELLAAVEMERFHDAEVNGSMLGLVAPKLSGERRADAPSTRAFCCCALFLAPPVLFHSFADHSYAFSRSRPQILRSNLTCRPPPCSASSARRRLPSRRRTRPSSRCPSGRGSPTG